jgi:hypothetical protein
MSQYSVENERNGSCHEPDGPAEPPDDNRRLRAEDGERADDHAQLHEHADPEHGQERPPERGVGHAREPRVRERVAEEARLEAERDDGGGREEEEAEPVLHAPPRERADRVPLRLARELVPVERHDEEVLDVLTDPAGERQRRSLEVMARRANLLPYVRHTGVMASNTKVSASMPNSHRCW